MPSPSSAAAAVEVRVRLRESCGEDWVVVPSGSSNSASRRSLTKVSASCRGRGYGSGMSREALKWATFAQCSFSTRNRVHMPRREISLNAIRKDAMELCCMSCV